MKGEIQWLNIIFTSGNFQTSQYNRTLMTFLFKFLEIAENTVIVMLKIIVTGAKLCP